MRIYVCGDFGCDINSSVIMWLIALEDNRSELGRMNQKIGAGFVRTYIFLQRTLRCEKTVINTTANNGLLWWVLS